MEENRQLEFKETLTNTFLKTVSAYANYDGGTVIFGVNDNGEVVGVDNPSEFRLAVENKINDSILPAPDYSLEITNGGKTVSLLVYPGTNKPYMYKSKAYKRNDTATIEVDSLEMRRLIMEGKNLTYEELPSDNQELSFSYLEKCLHNELGIESFSRDILKTLSLYSDKDGYNNAALLLADRNNCPGIEIVKFGNGINEIRDRVSIKSKSIIEQIDDAMKSYELYYVYEEINETRRRVVELIPRAAFREAVANALAHRTWDVNSAINVFMFEDRVEITSPGGLPAGISEEEYIKGGVSVPRNRIITEVLLRLGMIEKLGTGILRIREAYKNSVVNPAFEVRENSVKITLPTIVSVKLSEDELAVYKVFSKNIPMSTSEITKLVPFGKSKVLELVKSLCNANVLVETGAGRARKYKIKL